MSIAAVGSGHSGPVTPERTEGSGPDRDGDTDDSGVPASVQAAPAPGTGAVVDKTV